MATQVLKLGSGPDDRPMHQGPFCCNVDVRAGITCSRPCDASYTCQRCGLVSYCSTDCQQSQHVLHERHCQSRSTQEHITLTHLREGRLPSWMSTGSRSPMAGRLQEYLWRNVPA